MTEAGSADFDSRAPYTVAESCLTVYREDIMGGLRLEFDPMGRELAETDFAADFQTLHMPWHIRKPHSLRQRVARFYAYTDVVARYTGTELTIPNLVDPDESKEDFCWIDPGLITTYRRFGGALLGYVDCLDSFIEGQAKLSNMHAHAEAVSKVVSPDAWYDLDQTVAMGSTPLLSGQPYGYFRSFLLRRQIGDTSPVLHGTVD